jgi:hypothetical protein
MHYKRSVVFVWFEEEGKKNVTGSVRLPSYYTPHKSFASRDAMGIKLGRYVYLEVLGQKVML